MNFKVNFYCFSWLKSLKSSLKYCMFCMFTCFNFTAFLAQSEESGVYACDQILIQTQAYLVWFSAMCSLKHIFPAFQLSL